VLLIDPISRDTSECASSTFSSENRHLSAQFDCLHRIRTHDIWQDSGSPQRPTLGTKRSFPRTAANVRFGGRCATGSEVSLTATSARP